MAEFEEPAMRLTIEGFRWDGDEWNASGQSSTVEFHGTDSGPSADILRALRAELGARSQSLALVMHSRLSELDFSAPNAPTRDLIDAVCQGVDHLHRSVRALRELSPEIWDDDDDDDDGQIPSEPEPGKPEEVA